MNRNFTNLLALAGRILIAVIFVISGFGKIGGFEGVAGAIGSKGLPMPQVLAALTIALELGGGILLVLGFKTRWIAALFFLWLIPTTLVFHAFWGLDPKAAQQMQIHFLKNVSIMGAMLMLVAFGPGAWSLDKR
ncbi:MAG TPA: DoxX family protein [Usitatibacter sp.]|nr:DoxX family protein [Usitatibacter sp.]